LYCEQFEPSTVETTQDIEVTSNSFIIVLKGITGGWPGYQVFVCIGNVFLLWQCESCEFMSATLCVGRVFHFLVAQKLGHFVILPKLQVWLFLDNVI